MMTHAIQMTAGIILFMGLNQGCSTPATPPAQPAETEAFTMPVRTTPIHPRMMWASSHLYERCPDLAFDEWLTDQPDLKDKFIILEFWRTWCSACKKGTPFLNEIQQRYPDDFVVIGVNAQSAEQISNYNGPKKNYYLARDKPNLITKATPDVAEEADCPDGICLAPLTTRKSNEQGRLEAHFDVWGWPHVVILEPTDHAIIWEGFPGLQGYELTEDIIKKCISIANEADPE